MKTIYPGTVLVINNVTIIRDMIFGWCVLSSEGWLPLNDWRLKELLVIRKATIGYPLCPTDFSDAVSDRIDSIRNLEATHNTIKASAGKEFNEFNVPESEKEAERNASIFAAAAAIASIPVSTESKPDRTKDELALYKMMTTAMKSVGDEIYIDLTYCELTVFKQGTVLLKKKHREFPQGHGFRVFEDITGAVDFILKTYW